MKVTVLRIYGYTKNPFAPHGYNAEPFDWFALVMPKGLSDSMCDAVLAELYDRKQPVDYVFAQGKQIIGEHASINVVSSRVEEEFHMEEVQ